MRLFWKKRMRSLKTCTSPPTPPVFTAECDYHSNIATHCHLTVPPGTSMRRQELVNMSMMWVACWITSWFSRQLTFKNSDKGADTPWIHPEFCLSGITQVCHLFCWQLLEHGGKKSPILWWFQYSSALLTLRASTWWVANYVSTQIFPSWKKKEMPKDPNNAYCWTVGGQYCLIRSHLYK